MNVFVDLGALLLILLIIVPTFFPPVVVYLSPVTFHTLGLGGSDE